MIRHIGRYIYYKIVKNGCREAKMAKIEIDKDTFDFGHRLQELRVKRRLTQREVAERLRCHKNTIGKYENNERKPSYSVIKKLAFMYNTSTDFILDFSDRPFIFIDDLPKSKQDMIMDLVKSMQDEEYQRNKERKTGD